MYHLWGVIGRPKYAKSQSKFFSSPPHIRKKKLTVCVVMIFMKLFTNIVKSIIFESLV